MRRLTSKECENHSSAGEGARGNRNDRESEPTRVAGVLERMGCLRLLGGLQYGVGPRASFGLRTPPRKLAALASLVVGGHPAVRDPRHVHGSALRGVRRRRELAAWALAIGAQAAVPRMPGIGSRREGSIRNRTG